MEFVSMCLYSLCSMGSKDVSGGTEERRKGSKETQKLTISPPSETPSLKSGISPPVPNLSNTKFHQSRSRHRQVHQG